MFLDALKHINWVDILILIILFRICYVSIETGLPLSIFKLLGITLALYLSLHYYTKLSDFLRSRILFLESLPLELIDFICFLFLVAAGYLIMIIARIFVHRFVKMEVVSGFNRWGGFSLGLVRAVLLCGLLMYTLAVSGIGYLRQSAKDSLLGNKFFYVAPATYTWIWNALISKFSAAEDFNLNVTKLAEGFSKQ